MALQIWCSTKRHLTCSRKGSGQALTESRELGHPVGLQEGSGRRQRHVQPTQQRSIGADRWRDTDSVQIHPYASGCPA